MREDSRVKLPIITETRARVRCVLACRNPYLAGPGQDVIARCRASGVVGGVEGTACDQPGEGGSERAGIPPTRTCVNAHEKCARIS